MPVVCPHGCRLYLRVHSLRVRVYAHRLPPAEKTKQKHAEFFRITDFQLHQGAAGLRQICDADSGASRGDPAGARRQGRARDRADRNRQDAGVPDPDHRALARAKDARESKPSCSFPRANWPCRWWINTTRCAGSSCPPAALVVGGLPEAKQLAAIRAGARLIVATPGRLEDYLGRKLFNFQDAAHARPR